MKYTPGGHFGGAWLADDRLLFCMVPEKLLTIDLSKITCSVINLLVGCFGVLILFPKIYRAPFGPVPVRQYLKRIGLFLPNGAWRHILLGIVLAACTLSGMLAASILTGRYALDWSTINPGHILFS